MIINNKLEKMCKGALSSLTEGTIMGTVWGRRGKRLDISIIIIALQTEIRTRNVRNTNKKHYLFSPTAQLTSQETSRLL
jgi:hypothetical protein